MFYDSIIYSTFIKVQIQNIDSRPSLFSKHKQFHTYICLLEKKVNELCKFKHSISFRIFKLYIGRICYGAYYLW